MDRIDNNTDDPLHAEEAEYLDEDPEEKDPLGAEYGFEELYAKSPDIPDDLNAIQEDHPSSCDESVEANTIDEPEHKKKFFLADFMVKKYTRQKNGLCINRMKNVPETVSGDSLSEVLECLWNFIEPHVFREIDVSEIDGIKVSWSAKEKPDIRDIARFVYLKDTKRKNLVKIDQLGEGKIMLNWREKTIAVFAFVYSDSISSVAIWDEVNKSLLQPAQIDRAGAPNNINLDDLVRELKEQNSHLESHDSGWIQWATAIHASPAHLQEQMKNQMPPADMRGMFWALPTAESTRIESTRQGLAVAQNIVDNLAVSVHELCGKADQLSTLAFEVKLNAQCLKEKLTICRDMLRGMQSSTAPQETVLSQQLREQVGDMMDIDHA